MAVFLITGAAGFIGNEAGRYFRDQGHYCIGIDNLSRPIARYQSENFDEFYPIDCGDIRRIDLPKIDILIHLAAKTSVTRSITAPEADFDTNVRQSFDLLQWADHRDIKKIIFASSNKVYGELPGRRTPIGSDEKMDPITPYGIGKAAIASYVREFFPMNGYIFHQSCIWGESQIGSLDQGWIAFIAKKISDGEDIICYGDGNQIRDLLHVKDLLRIYQCAIDDEIDPGFHAIGGGIENSLSFLQAVNFLGGKIKEYRMKRKNDQDYFIARNETIPRDIRDNLRSYHGIKSLVKR